MKINFIDILTLIFLTLKLCKVISWSWWLVFSPMIIEFSLGIIVIIMKNLKEK